jgi:hypothetical protein
MDRKTLHEVVHYHSYFKLVFIVSILFRKDHMGDEAL